MDLRSISIIASFVLFGLVILASPCVAQTSQTSNQEIVELKPNQAVERTLKGGETDVFQIKLKARQFMHVKVEPSQSFDLVVTLFAPDGKQLVAMDGKNGRLWRQALSCVAQSAGPHRLEIKAYGATAIEGSYTAKVFDLRDPWGADTKRVEAEKALAEGRRLFEEAGTTAGAAKQFEIALALWREIGDSYWEAVTLTNLGWTQTNLSQTDNAIASHTDALKLFQKLKDRTGESKAANGLCLVHDYAGKPETAREFCEKALAIRRELKDRRGEGSTLFLLGMVNVHLRNTDKARECFEQALTINQEFKDRSGEREMQYRLGLSYLISKDYQKAQPHMEQALRIDRETNDQPSEAQALNLLSLIHERLFQYGTAQEYSERALDLNRKLKNPTAEIDTLLGLGTISSKLFQPAQAQGHYQLALARSRELKDRPREAQALEGLSAINLTSQRPDAARDDLELQLVISREIADQDREAHTLISLGIVYFQLHQFDRAFDYGEQGLALARKIKSESNEAYALAILGQNYAERGQGDKALGYLDHALRLRRKLNDRQGEAQLLGTLGIASMDLGDYSKAKEYYTQALSIAQTLPARQAETSALGNLGLVCILLGNYQEALDYFEQQRVLTKKIENRRRERDALTGMGLTYSMMGKYEHALEPYQTSLAISLALGDRHGEGSTLNYLGGVYANLGQYDRAREHHEKALVIAREVKNRSGESGSLTSLGGVYSNLSQYEKARQYYEESLIVVRGLADRRSEPSVLNGLGGVYFSLGQYEKAREYHEQALAIAREVKFPLAQVGPLNGLGFDYLSLNQYDKAKQYFEQGLALSRELKYKAAQIDPLLGFGLVSDDLSQSGKAMEFYQQSLTLIKELKNPRAEGISLNALGNAYLQLKQYDKARLYFEQALTIARQVKNKSDEANALINLGEVSLKLAQYGKARGSYDQALGLAREVASRSSESFALNGLGDVYQKLNQLGKAGEYYQQALIIARESGSKKLEGRVLWNLMELTTQQRNRRLAIFYGKQAINAFQAVRGNITSFDKESQHSFLKDKEPAYRALAALLISQNRLPEARAILDLLKEEEFASSSLGRGETRGVPLANAEARAIKTANNIVQVGREYDELFRKKESLDDPGRRRLKALYDELGVANGLHTKALAALSANSRRGDRYEDVSQEAKKFQADLRDLGAGTVALYTVIVTNEKGKTTDGLIILLTPSFEKAYTIDVADFDKTVRDFQIALKNPYLDPLPLAQRLYRKVFLQPSGVHDSTLAADLDTYFKDREDKTLMWHQDGVLRYLPMAALHDGQQYLVEKYRNTIFSRESGARLNADPKTHWTALGLGVSEPREEAGVRFTALSGTEEELKRIIRSEDSPHGVLPGIVKINKDFTREAMLDGLLLGSHPVVHISSHYSFQSADTEHSFLLLGQGRWTVAEMRKETTLFSGVDLVTLSACDTAMGGANGKDAEGFAFKVQDLGAKAVIASLWPVDDIGTQVLMPQFYRLRETGLTKAEAFQRAQLALLRGEVKDAPGVPRSSEVVGGDQPGSGLTRYVRDAQRPLAHPYYWAPFILIGNWK